VGQQLAPVQLDQHLERRLVAAAQGIQVGLVQGSQDAAPASG
jgi:hypothetical protein